MKIYHIQPGDKFNRLTAVSLHHIGNHSRSYFLFKCECGNEKVILGSLVKSGNTKSCGCLNRDIRRLAALPGSDGAINQLILGYKRHAKERKLSWDLTRGQVLDITSKDCHYCGAEPSNVKKGYEDKANYKYSGIDRVDSKKGYFYENCVPACKICNFAKSNLSYEEFRKWAISIGAMALQWGGDVRHLNLREAV